MISVGIDVSNKTINMWSDVYMTHTGSIISKNILRKKEVNYENGVELLGYTS